MTDFPLSDGKFVTCACSSQDMIGQRHENVSSIYFVANSESASDKANNGTEPCMTHNV